MGSILHHITPLLINSLGGGHTHENTHTCKHTHAYRHLRTEAILRKQALVACGWLVSGLKGKSDVITISIRTSNAGFT